MTNKDLVLGICQSTVGATTFSKIIRLTLVVSLQSLRHHALNTNRQYFNRDKVLLMNITTQEYEDLLDEAPEDHMSDEFIRWLENNNIVVLKTEGWLVIENVKYHTKELPWLTAFDLMPEMTWQYKLQLLQWEFPECKIIIHPPITQTVKRFRVHLIKADRQYTV